MKKRSNLSNRLFSAMLIITLSMSAVVSSCEKTEQKSNGSNLKFYSSEVLTKWMNMQVRLMKNATGIANHAFSRHYAYAGVAAVESMRPGINGNNHVINKWNGLSGLPVGDHKKDYYYPANVNAAMATINRLMFPNASQTDKDAIDSLENALKAEFLTKESAEIINKSVEYGKNVATAVFNWAETDGYKNANNAYVVPTGPGLWKPTPPAMTAPATPYWGNNRTIITGSITNVQPVPPPAYSTETSSPFYKMVKEVYDVSQTLTTEQKDMALYWRDVPGVSSPGHWLNILYQAVKIKESSLEDAAIAYALTGVGVNDALIACFKAKYQHNLVRPVTYIREVMGHTTWSPFLGTPAHPEYISAHSSLSAAAGTIMDKLLGSMNFTDHTYDYLGYGSRNYPSFFLIALEAGQSRLYAGIHYVPSIQNGLIQGNKVAENILSK